MSIETMVIAMHHSKSTGAARMVLVGIANHDGDGGAWPAIATLAKYANVDLRTARKAVRRLTELGEIEVMLQRGGNGNIEDYQRPNLYKFKLTCPPDCDRSKNHKTRDSISVEPLTSYPQPPVELPGEGNLYPRGGTQRPPKTSPNPVTKDLKNNSPSNRAREAWTKCETNYPDPHRINRRLGLCADCLAPLATITSPNRKEGDA